MEDLIKRHLDLITMLCHRHVGYGISTPLLGSYETFTVEVFQMWSIDLVVIEALSGSLGLFSKMLVLMISKCPAVVMRAINGGACHPGRYPEYLTFVLVYGAR